MAKIHLSAENLVLIALLNLDFHISFYFSRSLILCVLTANVESVPGVIGTESSKWCGDKL